MSRLKLLLCVLLALLAVTLAPTANAQSGDDALSVTVEVGFDGYVKTNAWAPVQVTATNTGPSVAGEVRLTTNYPGETYARALSLPSGSKKSVTLFAQLRGDGRFTLEFVTASGQLLYRRTQTPRMLPPDIFMAGVVSSDPSQLNVLAGLRSASSATGSNEPLAVAHLILDQIPEQAAGLSALDALIFNDVDTTPMTPAQRRAVADWVSLGGRLVVGGGPNAAATVAGLADLLPVASLSIQTFPTLVDLGSLVAKAVPDQGPYLVAVPGETSGTVDLYEQGNPLLVHQTVGVGTVTYFGLDFGLAPMDGWAGNEAFWTKILRPLQNTPPFYTTYEAANSINDALANIAVAGLPSPVSLLVFLCTYIVVLVPLNYFVLKRIGRREWAWITIPALIILFTLVGYVGGFRSRSGQVMLRQVSVVRQSEGAARAAVDTFIGLYSPARDHYTLKFAGDVLVQPTDGGSNFKGVKRTASAPTTIFYGPRTELQNLWTDIGSMATALAHGQTQARPIEVNVTLNRQGSRWQASGAIINNSGQTLDDAVLLIGNRGVQLSRLKPGRTKIDHPLRVLNTRPYGDTTLWGEYYYQLGSAQERLNDQIIKSVFWPGSAGANRLLGLGLAIDPDTTVVLLGWQYNTPPETRIEVVGRSVSSSNTNLLIVTARLKDLLQGNTLSD
ncbi:MAG: hypothetical protein ACE5G8_00345 [Anaerolineae bacterium]